MIIDRLDHLVLTVRDIEATCAFYTQVLGMREVSFGEGRKALAFGNQKINLHQAGHEFASHEEVSVFSILSLCSRSSSARSSAISARASTSSARSCTSSSSSVRSLMPYILSWKLLYSNSERLL